MSEVWKTVPGFPLLEVSDQGNVRRFDQRSQKWRNANLTDSGRGYRFVAAPTTGKPLMVHRLVCLAFHGQPPEGKPFAAHWDGDATNNRADNLRWASPLENSHDRSRHGRAPSGDSHPHARLNASAVLEIRRHWRAGMAFEQIAKIFGVNASTVSRAAQGKYWRGVA